MQNPVPSDLPPYLNRSLRHDLVRRLAQTARRRRTGPPGQHIMWHEWGQGRPVVLLHGNFGSWLHWVKNIEVLAQNFRVIAGDLPGLGESDPLPEEKPTGPEIAAPLIDGIREMIGPDQPFDLVSFSLGAAVGAHVAMAMLGQVRKIVVIGVPGLSDALRDVAGGLRRREAGMSEAEVRELIRFNLLNSMLAQPSSVDDFTLDLQTDLVGQKGRLFGAPVSRSDVVPRLVPQVIDRITVVWGEHDIYLLPSVAASAASTRKRFPKLDLRIAPGAGHWAAYEQPRYMNELIEDVLRRSSHD